MPIWRAKQTQLLAPITSQNGGIVLERVYGEKERCGRVWKGEGVSALEFATWIGDVTLMNALLAKVPAYKKEEALKQLIGVRDKGLEHGKHMAPFHAFIEICRTYDRDFDKFEDWDSVAEYCIKIIGGAEKLLSLFGLQWFCDEEPFEPIPRFDRAPSRVTRLQDDPLLLILSGLGENFYIYIYYKHRSDARYADGVVVPWVPWRLALESLCKVSLVALDSVISQLQHEITATLTNSNS